MKHRTWRHYVRKIRRVWRPGITQTLRVVVLAVLATALGGPSAAERFSDERSVVETLHDTLLEAMRRGENQSLEQRRASLMPTLERCFDFPFMAEKSAGRYWRELEASERNALVTAMSGLAVSNYASRFNAYDGERFETLGAEPAAYETVLVKTQIVQASGAATRLDYRMRRDPDGHPRIVDVFLNGTVSELAMRRAEYSSVIKREGFAALLSALQKRAAALPVSAGR